VPGQRTGTRRKTGVRGQRRRRRRSYSVRIPSFVPYCNTDLIFNLKHPARNPNTLPSTSAFGRFFVALGGALCFFKTADGIFALQHAVVSLALWVPAVMPRTAWFYYANKGLWALIMGQMGLATFAGDQLFGLARRLVGTALGLLNGMVVWYIAAPGKGDGNVYAAVVVTVRND
jgi:hypothetical protein